MSSLTIGIGCQAVFQIRIRIGYGFNQVSRSGSGLDPDSIRSVDPDSESESRSGSRRAKMTYKNRKKLRNFMLWSAGRSLLRAEGFSCSLDVLYGGLGISKLQFFIKELSNFFPAVIFFPILEYQYPGSGAVFSPKWCILIRIPVLDSMNPDPKHWCQL